MNLDRREFLRLTGLGALAALLPTERPGSEELTMSPEPNLPLRLTPEDTWGAIARAEGAALIPDATWYLVEEHESGLSYRFPAGALAKASYLTAEMLLEGNTMVVFALALQEGELLALRHGRIVARARPRP